MNHCMPRSALCRSLPSRRRRRMARRARPREGGRGAIASDAEGSTRRQAAGNTSGGGRGKTRRRPGGRKAPRLFWTAVAGMGEGEGATTARLHYYNLYTLRAHTGAYFINKLDIYQFHRDIRHVGSQNSRSLLRARDHRAPVGISGGTAPGGSF